MDQTAVAEYFDDTAEDYTSDATVEELDAYPLVDGYVRERAAPGDRMLEVGCGDGLLLQYAVETTGVAEGVGVDISEGMLRRCRPHRSVERAAGTATSLPFRPGSFDFVVFSDVLHHLVGDTRRESKETAVAALEEAVGLLADGGHLVVKDIYYDSPAGPDALSSHLIFRGLKHVGPLAAVVDREARSGLLVCFFTRGELVEMVESAGVTVRETEVDRRDRASLARRLLVGDSGCIRLYASDGELRSRESAPPDAESDR